MHSPSSTDLQPQLETLVAELAAINAEAAATAPKRDKAYLEAEVKRTADLLSQTRHRERMDEWEAEEARQMDELREGFARTTEAEARIMAAVSAEQRKNPPPRGHVSSVAVIIANRAKEDGHLRRSLRIGKENERPSRTPPPTVETFAMRCEHVDFEWMAFGINRPIKQNIRIAQVAEFTEKQAQQAVGHFTKAGERQFIFVGPHAAKNEKRFASTPFLRRA
jgi:hypothetical protein